jgi:hypothetical protein
MDGLVPGNLGVTNESDYAEISGGNFENLSVRSGETCDLGDIQMQPMT